MLESVSHYVMPGESETETTELIHSLGLDGIENLIYGTTPSPSPFTRLTVGAHLKFWPTWMDFYLGNKKRVQKQYPDKQSLIACYGADTPEKWIEEIKKISVPRWQKNRTTLYGTWRTALWKKRGQGNFTTPQKKYSPARLKFTKRYTKKYRKTWKSSSKIFFGRACAHFLRKKQTISFLSYREIIRASYSTPDTI